MKVNFSDSDLEEFCTTGKSKKSAYKKYVRDGAFMRALARALSAFVYAPNTAFLRDNYSFLHYERLTDNMSGRSSVRIMNGRVERLIFTESEEGIEIEILELNTTHYGNKK